MFTDVIFNLVVLGNVSTKRSHYDHCYDA